MAFTDNSDLYGAVREAGINKAVQHIMRQRPSLFNYGTERVARFPRLLCKPIAAIADVQRRGNSLLTIEEPLPILGAKHLSGLDFCVQLTNIRINFHPDNGANLPPELNPPLQEQRFTVTVDVCAGMSCLTQKDIDDIDPDIPQTFPDPNGGGPPPVQLPPRPLQCFCLRLVALAGFELTGPTGRQTLQAKVDTLEIVDVKPQGLEANLECYLNLLLQLVVLPKTSVAVEKLTFELLTGLPSISLFPTPNVSLDPDANTVPNNPAVEDDQLKVFVEFEVSA